MGAAWVTKTKSDVILLPGFSPDDICGFIGKDTMSIYWDGKEETLQARLGMLKDTVVKEFGLDTPPEGRWKRKRNALIDQIRNNHSSETETEDD